MVVSDREEYPMSSLRSHDDTWDIATSVGSTAVMVVAARQGDRQHRSADPRSLRPRSGQRRGPGMWESFLEDGMKDRIAEADPAGAALFANMLSYQAVRTHFFDRFFARSVEAGIRQVVILASGLDSRAYRLPWPVGTVVYEIDQPKVLGIQVHDAGSRVCRLPPNGERWPSTCARTGRSRAEGGRFRPEPSYRLAGRGSAHVSARRGAGPAVRADHRAQRARQQGSAEAVRHHDEQRRARMRERWEKMATNLGIDRNVDIQERPQRPWPLRRHRLAQRAWVGRLGHGVHRRNAPAGPLVEVPEEDYQDGFSTFVIAERQPAG